MSLFRQDLDMILTYYDGIYQMYSKQLENSPPGSLLYQKNHGKDQFLHAFTQDGERIRQCITKDCEMIKALAQKEFAQKAVRILAENITVLRNAIDNMVPFDPDDILHSMLKGYSKLPEDYFFDRSNVSIGMHLDDETKARIDRHREWGAQPYNQSRFREEYKTIRTSRGLAVRSKSEALIIETLYRWHDIPHRYEQEKVVNGIRINPDITLEDYQQEEFYIEHLGMMDDPGYARRNFRKLERYYDAGLVPGDNLILTFDRRGSINMGMIEAVVMHEVIPRL